MPYNSRPRDVLKILTDAKRLLSNPINWTQEVMARDVRGIPVQARASNACRWCALGAMHRVNPDVNLDMFRLMTDHQRRWDSAVATADKTFKAAGCDFFRDHDVYLSSTTKVNDYSTHDVLMQIFDMAIERVAR